MSLPLETLGASRVADFGPNSGRTMEPLSSTTTQPRRSVTCIAPFMRTARRLVDPRLLLLLINALQKQQLLLQLQQQQQLCHLNLQVVREAPPKNKNPAKYFSQNHFE